jgi:hypothetical protein
MLIVFLLLLVFIFWSSVSSTRQNHIECVDDLKKKIQTYKHFFRTLNGRDITPEEWEAETKSLNIYHILKDLNLFPNN